MTFPRHWLGGDMAQFILVIVSALGYSPPMSAQTSRLRQRLREAGQRHQLRLERLLAEAGPLIRGAFGSRRRVCGTPGCHCARGELHESKYLTANQGGKVRQVHVPAAEVEKVASGVARYQRFGQLRAELADLAQRQLELVDELGRSLIEPYPRDRPLPPPVRVSRRRPGGHRHGRG